MAIEVNFDMYKANTGKQPRGFQSPWEFSLWLSGDNTNDERVKFELVGGWAEARREALKEARKLNETLSRERRITFITVNNRVQGGRYQA